MCCCHGKNHVIGDGEDLIWHLPGDLRRVKQLTMGCPLIMGRPISQLAAASGPPECGDDQRCELES